MNLSSNSVLQIQHDFVNEQIEIISNSKINLSIENCFHHRSQRSITTTTTTRRTSSIVLTFNSSSYIDYHHKGTLDYPLRLSVRFRTIGRISNGVLLSLAHRNSSLLIYPFLVVEHVNGKIELTILELHSRQVLTTVNVSEYRYRIKISIFK